MQYCVHVQHLHKCSSSKDEEEDKVRVRERVG